ncbi:MAG TPA: phosphatidylserine/phosphatidylglycerophosphate/cardiolipin synthase family protein [Candidatus Limnocylindrales bacterium]|nr:phosphatidylserine/phosphatidylglycerophosphate/cardiolipin synthase family protein [Candidatus Limnocylindrales bacterium]
MLGLLVVAAGAALWASWPQRPEPAPPPLPPFQRGLSLRETFETLPGPGQEASLRLFTDNTEAWAERWRLLESAEHSIDVSYFILHEDIFGLSFLGHLLERARNGVSVRMLLDALGTKMSREIAGNGYLQELGAGKRVSLRTYRPLWRRWTEGLLTLRPSAIVASEHDKIMVIDGRRSLTGGRNIAVEYFSDPRKDDHAFKDVDVRIDSKPVAAALVRAFEHQFASEDAVSASGAESEASRSSELLRAYAAMDRWLHGKDPEAADDSADWLAQLREHTRLRGALLREPAPPLRAETRILDSHTRFNAPDDQITEGLWRLVQAATREIFVQTPYVVLSEQGVRALEDAAARGVAITLVTNSPVSSDNALSQAFFLEQWPELLARVPTLRLFVAGREHNLHAKAVTFDGEVALVGTYNLDPVSMAFNSEVMAAAWSQQVAGQVEATARAAIARGAPELFEYRIERDSAGRAVRGEDGRVAVRFGPRDHCTPEEWAALGAYWTVLKAAKDFVGFSPIL